MKLSTREDIDRPLEDVYAAVTNFESFERQMLRRGVEVRRDDSRPLDQIGARWFADFKLRGRPQSAEAELVLLDPGQGYAVETRSGGIVSMAVVDLIALSKTRTRMLVSLDVRPTTLSSRLLIQSLRLAKGNLTRRFKDRVRTFAERLN